ncbi:hypothetical protein NM688_g7446 [Phlebia brevispora]|uniref:Uncharacterized protein n=1 Tax=Phlebia brevispora TaxID=194682 RepID=A0ACC1S564_9APHY|nr:hypothetical protein NM688_g7446 [Phlebia brevispora]
MVLDTMQKIQVPASINTFLRDYQREGVQFFWKRYNEGNGGLLGDDMGLGKTIQVIAFLSAIMRKTGDSRDVDRRRKHVSCLQDGEEWKRNRKLPKANAKWPTALIVAPSSVVWNWAREFDTWGFFEVGVYSAEPGQDRREVLNEFRLGRLDVLITSFDLARRDIDLLDAQAWSVVIVDEAHRIKNARSKLTIAFNRFECQSRFGLTGTAIQNDYSELWTILDWTNPGAIGTRKQWEGFVTRPLTRGQSRSASEDERIVALRVARILKDKFLPKYFLRRTKALIKDQLPEKIDQVVFCPLTPTQIEVYKRVLRTTAVQNLIRKDERCDCGSKNTRKNCCHPYEKGALFRYMSTLIKISNHLALILPAPGDSPEQTARNREIASEVFNQEDIPKYGPAVLQPRLCGKWLVLETLLEGWRKDPSNKVLIFTKSVKLLDMLDFHLRSQGLGFVKLDGSTKQSDRMPMIDRFHDDPDIFVFLISTLAGGTGLNLTGANKVVIFDPNWNPAHDLQAMDRAYRYGQTRDVEVFRLLGAGSLEELIYARQVYKQQQMAVGYDASLQTRYFEGVQGDKARQGELFGIRNIFKLHEDTLATKQAIERANLLDLDWALANMDAKASRKPSLEGKQWIYEAEAKGKKEDICVAWELYSSMTASTTFTRVEHPLLMLITDTPPLERENEIQKELSDIGVNYTHRNEDVIAENIVEARRLEALLKEHKESRKKKKASAGKEKGKKEKEASPEPEWPPKRRHHKKPLTPREKLMQRREALLELEIIQSPEQILTFAQEFSRTSPDEQAQLLATLDRHAREAQRGTK